VSYQQGGYPQQPYPGAGGYPAAPGGGTNPATAILAAILALAVAGFEGTIAGQFFGNGGSFNLPTQFIVSPIVQIAVGLFLLIGAILMFARKLAGAILAIIGSIMAIAMFFLEPVIISDGKADIGRFIEAVFQFEQTETIFRALILIVAPLALILAVIPPTLKHLKGVGNAPYAGDGYPGYPNPQGGYPQQQQGW
jgi:hypothetical protein